MSIKRLLAAVISPFPNGLSNVPNTGLGDKTCFCINQLRDFTRQTFQIRLTLDSPPGAALVIRGRQSKRYKINFVMFVRGHEPPINSTNYRETNHPFPRTAHSGQSVAPCRGASDPELRHDLSLCVSVCVTQGGRQLGQAVLLGG